MKKSTRQLSHIECKCETASSTDSFNAILDNAVEVVRLAAFVADRFDWKLSLYDYRDSNVAVAKTLLEDATSKFWKKVEELGFSRSDLEHSETNFAFLWNKTQRDQMKPFKISNQIQILSGCLKHLDKFHFKWIQDDAIAGHFTFKGRSSIDDVVKFIQLMCHCEGRIFVGAKAPLPDAKVYVPVVDYAPYQSYFPKDVYVHSVVTKIEERKLLVFITIGDKLKAKGKKR